MNSVSGSPGRVSAAVLRMPSGMWPRTNPLPPVRALRTMSAADVKLDDAIPADERKYFGWHRYTSTLPYLQQDEYDRSTEVREFRTAVLENDRMRAEFLLDFGGRLWSLTDRATGRNLLYTNPVFRPANLAIRNAWFCGGVEWNCGVLGHSPFTCSPVFAASLRGADGGEILRLYEYERISGVPWQIDFRLDPERPLLYARVTLRNPHDRQVPMYWWSNIAVPETAATRVLVRARDAYRHGYSGGFRLAQVPQDGDLDLSRPQAFPGAADAYFRITEPGFPWIASVEADGRGLFHASTPRLLGRKLFVWGMGAGGRRWQEFLSVPGHAYIEIQGGLCHTQAEYIPMPARACWEWLEAYGMVEGAPETFAGPDYAAACDAAEASIRSRITPERLATEFAAGAEDAVKPPEALLREGSGWGALEQARLSCEGAEPFAGPEIPFTGHAVGPEQEPWFHLLNHGVLPAADPRVPPASYVQGETWLHLLEAAVAGADAENWATWYHVGIVRYAAGEADAAREAWRRSLTLSPTAWAERCLALAAAEDGDAAEALRGLERAVRLQPGLRALNLEALRRAVEAEDVAAAERIAAAMPADQREYPRIRLLRARLAYLAGRYDEAEALLEGPEVPDIREGEVRLTDLWFDIRTVRLAAEEGVPVTDELKRRVRSELVPPRHLDFRMSAAKP